MRRVAAFLLIMPAAGCVGTSDRSIIGFEAVDSAGIELARNGSHADTIALEPDLTIGTVDGPEELQFFRVVGITADAGGAIFVGDGSGVVREFDSAGALVRSMGGRGDGPGEFQWPSRIFLYGDTVAVADARQYRVTAFSRSGELIETLPYRHERAINFPWRRVAGGWVVQSADLEWKLEVGRARRDTTRLIFAHSLVWNSGDTTAAREMVGYESGRVYGINYGTGGMTANSPLWEPAPSHAVDASGNIYVSRGLPYRIDVYDADGILWRSIMREHTPIEATKELNDRYWDKVNAYLDTTTNKHGEWQITVAAERGRADLPVNGTLPALGRLIVSDDGMLWAQRPDLTPDPLTLEWSREPVRQDSFWDVFDHEGRLVATVRLPAAFRASSAAGRSIYGVLRDDMDVEYVARITLPVAH